MNDSGPDPLLLCRQKAFDLLARRAHFEQELAGKLRRRGFASTVVEATIAGLRDSRMVDDVAAAEMFLAELRRRGYGRRRVAAGLRARGARPEAIDEALRGLGEQEEMALARQVAAKGKPQEEKASIARRLERKGFAERVILNILDERIGSG